MCVTGGAQGSTAGGAGFSNYGPTFWLVLAMFIYLVLYTVTKAVLSRRERKRDGKYDVSREYSHYHGASLYRQPTINNEPFEPYVCLTLCECDNSMYSNQSGDCSSFVRHFSFRRKH